jgi:hypothetical protein
MSGLKPIVIAALLILSVSVGHASDDPFFYFATQDPFSPGTSITKNDIYLFGGVFADRSFGNVGRFWNADYTDNYMIGGVAGRDFRDLGAGFVLGGVAGAAIRFGDDDDTSGEFWAGLRIRHHGLVIGDLAIAPGLTAGLSVVTGPTEIERRREVRYEWRCNLSGIRGAGSCA